MPRPRRPFIRAVSEGHALLCEIPISGTQLAAALEVDPSRVSRWLSGAFPADEQRQTLSRLYGIPPESWDRVADGSEDESPEGGDAPLSSPRGDATLAEVERSLEVLRAARDDQRETTATKLKAVQLMTPLLSLRAKLAGDSRDVLEKLTGTAEFQEFEQSLIDALKPFPDALRAVRDRFGRIREDGESGEPA